MRIAAFARRQLTDYDAHTPGLAFADHAFSLTGSEAYEVQRQVAALRARRGEKVAGYKIGCVSPAVQRQLGIDRPVFGHLFASEIHRAGARIDAAKFERLAIEGEFAVRAACDIPSAAWLSEHAGEAIAAVFPVIELHNYVFRRASPTAEELIANNALHAGFVIGKARAGWRSRSISVFRGCDLLGTATVKHDRLLASVRAVVEHLAASGVILRRDQIVLTGSPLPLYPAKPGDRFIVREKPGD